MLKIVQADTADELAHAGALFREYFGWWAQTHPEDFAEAETFGDWEGEIAALPGVYAPPSGRLLMAVIDHQPAGCIGLKRVDALTCEIKRFFVRPGFRGLQIGWQLARTVVAEARLAGYRRIVLDTHVSLKKAQSLYASLGFRVVDAPADFPEDQKADIIFMELALVPGQS